MRCYLEDFNLLSSTCCKTEAARSIVFDRISYPPLILAFCSSVHPYGPLHIYPGICSVAPCLRVLWMSTHGCFSPSFPPFLSTWLSQPDAGVQELEIPRMILHGVRLRGVVRRIPGRRPCLFDRCYFCASLLKANLINLCLYSDIVASADSFMFEHLYSSPRGPWLVL